MDDVMKLVLFLSKWVWEEEEKTCQGWLAWLLV